MRLATPNRPPGSLCLSAARAFREPRRLAASLAAGHRPFAGSTLAVGQSAEAAAMTVGSLLGTVCKFSRGLSRNALALAGALANKHAIRCSPNGTGHGLLRACPIRA